MSKKSKIMLSQLKSSIRPQCRKSKHWKHQCLKAKLSQCTKVAKEWRNIPIYFCLSISLSFDLLACLLLLSVKLFILSVSLLSFLFVLFCLFFCLYFLFYFLSLFLSDYMSFFMSFCLCVSWCRFQSVFRFVFLSVVSKAVCLSLL